MRWQDWEQSELSQMQTDNTRVNILHFSLGLVVIFTTFSMTLIAAQWLVTRL